MERKPKSCTRAKLFFRGNPLVWSATPAASLLSAGLKNFRNVKFQKRDVRGAQRDFEQIHVGIGTGISRSNN